MTETSPIPLRRPGKPKGYPKPPGSGRKPGQRNKRTEEIATLCQQSGPRIIKKLKHWAFKSEDPIVSLKALAELLNRGWGRPPADQTVITNNVLVAAGAQGPMPDVDLARRAVYLMRQHAREIEGCGGGAALANGPGPTPSYKIAIDGTATRSDTDAPE